ncbi:MAG: AraC family transcriptional regulator, partial [Clostridia bacterium]|nr:AraC family transcriptional regulator [Clostridia bacterium]
GIAEHLQICHEITFIISGSGFVSTDSEEMKASAGDVFLTRKGQMHTIRSDKQSILRYYYFAFDFNENAEKTPYSDIKDLFLINNTIKKKDTLEMNVPFSKLISEMYYLSDFSKEMINTYIDQILLMTARLFLKKEKSNYIPMKTIKPIGYTVYAVIRYIGENIYTIESISQMAKDLGYCDSYLSRIFKEKMGMTLQAYITMKKMEKAVEMIERGDCTITEIAFKLNFESLQSFSKSFRRTIGISPMDYRKEFFKKSKEQ